MPKNKYALIRYRVINRCLKDFTFVTKKQLKEACERALDIYPIGYRTIDGDIHAMRYDAKLGYKAPIKMDRINKVYYYEDPDYSIDNIPLNQDELDSIVFASKLLEQFKDIEIFRMFSGSVQKLVDVLSIYRNYDEKTLQDSIEFEKAEKIKGNEFIKPLMDALKNKNVLELEYRSFYSNENLIHIIHPYFLKEYRNRWYIIGYNEEFKGIRTYCLDRIISINIVGKIKFFDSSFNAKEYYKNVIGISVPDNEPVEIHLSFTKEQAQYVITQPLHSSQELINETKDSVVFRYFLVPNFEFMSQVLGWGEEVEVIKSEGLRKEIKEIVQKIIQKYQ